MTTATATIDELRLLLLDNPGVVTKRMFGAEAYFVGTAMFAFFTTSSLVLRLPSQAFGEAVGSGLARPFLSLGAAQLNRWAEVPFGAPPDVMVRLVQAAHTSGAHAARYASRRKRPIRARRVRRAGRGAR